MDQDCREYEPGQVTLGDWEAFDWFDRRTALRLENGPTGVEIRALMLGRAGPDGTAHPGVGFETRAHTVM